MKWIATLVVCLALLAPSTALASSACEAYNPQTCTSVSTSTSSGSKGTLPFTGLDAVLLLVGGGTLLATGFGVRRLSRRLD